MVLKIKLRLGQNSSGNAQSTKTESTPCRPEVQGSESASRIKESIPLCSEGPAKPIPKLEAFPAYHVYPEPSLPSATSETPNLSYDSPTSSRSSSVQLKTPASTHVSNCPTELQLGQLPGHLEPLNDGSQSARKRISHASVAKEALERAQPDRARASSLHATDVTGISGHRLARAKEPSQNRPNKQSSPSPFLQNAEQASGPALALDKLVLDVQRWPSLWSDLELPDPLGHQPMEGKSDTVVAHHYMTKQLSSERAGLYPIFPSLRETLFKLDHGEPAYEALAPRFRDPSTSISRSSQPASIVQYAPLDKHIPSTQYASTRAETSWLRSYCYKLPTMTTRHSAFAADPATGQIGPCSGLCNGKPHHGGYYCRFCRGQITSNMQNSPIGKLWTHLVPTAAPSPVTSAGQEQGWRYSCCPSLGAGEDALAFLGAIEELDRIPLIVAKEQMERRRVNKTHAQRQRRMRAQMAALTAMTKKKAKKGNQKGKASARKSTPAAGKNSLSREVVLKAAVLASGGVIPQRGLSPLTPTKTMEAHEQAKSPPPGVETACVSQAPGAPSQLPFRTAWRPSLLQPHPCQPSLGDQIDTLKNMVALAQADLLAATGCT